MSEQPDEQQQEQPDDDGAPGWDAISASLDHLYPGQQARHFGTLISYRLGGNDPLDGISVYKRMEPLPHWHFVTFGLSELYAKESEDAAVSGYGFELTFRLAAPADEMEPPNWAMNLLQNLARYVFKTGNVFEDGHWMAANGPISLSRPTALCSMGFVLDPELTPIDTPNGSLNFLQLVGLSLDEERAAKQWQTKKLLQTLLPWMPLWITDLDRPSLLDNPAVRAEVEQGAAADGSSSGFLYTDVLAIEAHKRMLRHNTVTITVGARQVEELLILLPLRLPFDRGFLLAGHDWQLRFEPAIETGWKLDDGLLTLGLTPAALQAFGATLQARAGQYHVDGLADVTWNVEQTRILDSDGECVETIG